MRPLTDVLGIRLGVTGTVSFDVKLSVKNVLRLRFVESNDGGAVAAIGDPTVTPWKSPPGPAIRQQAETPDENDSFLGLERVASPGAEVPAGLDVLTRRPRRRMEDAAG